MRQLLELAQHVNGEVVGSDQIRISDVATLANSRAGSITFATSEKNYEAFLASDASAVVVSRDIQANPSRSAIVVENVTAAFTEIVKLYRPQILREPSGIHPTAVVSDDAIIEDGVSIHAGAVVLDGVRIGSGTVIFPNVTVMENCQIGSNCKLFPNCVLYENTVVGDRVVLHAGAVVGAWGFGYESSRQGHRISAQLGNVVLEDDVELGANTTIDRGTFDSTVIGEGTKMDDQVMVGHNCRIGKHNLFCSQVGIAGSCRTGDFVVMGGQVGLGDHLTIGDRVSIGAKSGLMHDVESGQRVMGIPARPIRQAMQILALESRLPAMRKELQQLQKKYDQLVESNDRSISRKDAA